jgi:hypothetical protein
MRRLALPKILLVALACLVALAARGDEIEVRAARLAATEDGIALEADFAFDLGPRLAEALANGVPLYFVVEFELTRRRWWWFDEKAASKRMQLRIAYHPLSRQYRFSTGLLHQQFASLGEALNVLKRVRSWIVVERAALPLADANHEAAVRMRLDLALLPKPFQVSALTSRELHLESPWRRFSFRPPPQEPAEAKEAAAK